MLKDFRQAWPNIYTLPNNFLNLRVARFLLLGDIVAGTIGYMLIEHYSFVDAIYMVIITISTVGYTEVQELSFNGKIFSSIFIVANIGIFAYLLSVFSYYIIQGEFYKKLHHRMIASRLKKLNDHVILCGYGKYGKEISSHFEKHDIPFVVIEVDEKKIETIQKGDNKFLYIQNDATHDEALQAANIGNARALISALGDDTDNLFIVLTARQMNPKLNIISRAKNPRSEQKLLLAGANRVVMPEQIGGFYMATLVTKPDAVEFFSFITNEYQSDIGFEEISYEQVPAHCKNKSIRELNIRRGTGANIIGLKDINQQYIVNPGPETLLRPGSSFIVLGNRQQLDLLESHLKNLPI